jgi:hypothetical protein
LLVKFELIKKNNTMRTNRLKAMIALEVITVAIMIFTSCGKEDVDTPSSPLITKVSPDTANIGTEVTISGTNFTTDETKLTLKISEIIVTPTSLTLTEIKFIVPEGINEGVSTIVVQIEGRPENATATITIEKSITDSWSWTKIGTSNIEWFESPIVTYNNKFWQIAGERWDENLDTYVFTNNIYNSSDGLTWHLVNDNPDFLARALNRTTVYNEKLITVGGVRDGDSEGSDVWSSPNGDEWTMESNDQFAGRERFGLVEFNDNLWVFGGGYYDFESEPQRYVFTDNIYKSSDSKSWEKVTPSSVDNPLARIDFFTFVFEDKLWVVSGNTDAVNQKIRTDIWNSTDGKAWSLVDSDGPLGEVGDLISMSSLVFDNKIWILDNGKGYYSVDGKDWVKITDEADEWGRLIDAVVFDNSLYVFAEEGDVWQLKSK